MRVVTWRESVRAALERYVARHGSVLVTRQHFIVEELSRIVAETRSQGQTPEQTLSRVLQELRDEGLLAFLGDGRYLFLGAEIDVSREDLPDDAIDHALRRGRLRIPPETLVGSAEQRVRVRRGQARLRRLTLENYGHQCAFCDVRERSLLVTAHIVRWSESARWRGALSNTMALCRLHDPLFEYGYLGLTDDYRVVRKLDVSSQMVRLVLENTRTFRVPRFHPPDPALLAQHRQRHGLNKYDE